MNVFKIVFRELAGLFVDDGALALEIVTVVIAAAICRMAFPNTPLIPGGILLFGCLGVLLINIGRSRTR
jgi:hypothetical protein